MSNNYQLCKHVPSFQLRMTLCSHLPNSVQKFTGLLSDKRGRKSGDILLFENLLINLLNSKNSGNLIYKQPLQLKLTLIKQAKYLGSGNASCRLLQNYPFRLLYYIKNILRSKHSVGKCFQKCQECRPISNSTISTTHSIGIGSIIGPWQRLFTAKESAYTIRMYNDTGPVALLLDIFKPAKRKTVVHNGLSDESNIGPLGILIYTTYL